MNDRLSPSQRSEIMSRIRGRDTLPERTVRRLLHKLGYRFRLYRHDLPGRPDIVLPRHHAIIFVHGCFWHGHEHCRRSSVPKSRTDYWAPKIAKTKERDKRNSAQLRVLGWRVLTIRECETTKLDRLA